MDKINQIATDHDKMRLITGFGDGAPGGDLTKDLFTMLALLELYSSAYLEADNFFARAQSASSATANKPSKDRLFSYMQLIGQLKKGPSARKGPRKSQMGSAASQRTASSSRASEKAIVTSPPINIKALKKVDLTNAEEFFKLKGAVLDEHLLRLILKSFTSKSENRVQEERMQSESALNQKQKAMDDIVSAEIENLQKQLMQEKQKVLTAEDDLTMAIDCAINSDEQA